MRKLVGEEGVVQVRGTPTFVGKRSYHSFATHVPKKVYRIMPSSLSHGSWLAVGNQWWEEFLCSSSGSRTQP